jgi:hypothetical protein
MIKDPHLEAHEDLCSERYKNLEKFMERIEGIVKLNSEDIVEIKTNMSVGIGFWKATCIIGAALLGVGGLITAVVQVFR